ncbi:hypothetical protein [Glutamicibacter sp. NPDC087344]|uniref:hypothetical protein n=1 Tax=Glutamicibacter sp. NPDC087344 TaxID=3363994 RepID=UPI0037F39FE3
MSKKYRLITATLAGLSLAIAPIAGATADDSLVNPENEQNYSVTFPTSNNLNVAMPAASSTSRGGVLSGAATEKVNKHKGSFRISFSSGVVLNRAFMPSQATISGESQNIWKGTKVPSKISLTDKIVVSGVGLTASASNSGVNVGGSLTTKNMTWSSSASKKKSISHTLRNWKFGGMGVYRVQQGLNGAVHFGSAAYDNNVGQM